MNVCQECSKFGKVVSQVSKPVARDRPRFFSAPAKPEEKTEILVEDYSSIIKKRRETMGLSQKDFASKLNEKESTIHKLETGHFEPNLSLARKLEKILGVKLVEEYKESFEKGKQQKEAGFTLGDFIKIRK